MGAHKTGQVIIGSYVDIELRDYLDKLVKEHGFGSRSDAMRAILSEHRTVFSKIIDRNTALTPSDVKVKDKHHKENKRVEKPLK